MSNIEAKTKLVPSKENEFKPEELYEKFPEDFEPVRQEKKVKEIRGRAVEISYDYEKKNGLIVIEDIEGKRHEVKLIGAKMFNTYMYTKGWFNQMSAFRSGDEKKKVRMVQQALDKKPRKPYLFRVAKTAEDEDYLFGILSDRWRAVRAEDYVDTVEEVMEELNFKGNIKVIESDGEHGGYIKLESGATHDVIQPKAEFDFGLFDGYHKCRGKAGGMILHCSNEMTIDVRGKMSDLDIGGFSSLSKNHWGTDEEFKELVTETLQSMGKYSDIIDNSKKVGVTDEKIEKILQYYVDKNIISDRTRGTLMEALEDEEVQQVPNTLFGLSMVLSYVGTHEDLSPGVLKTLQRLSGEILVVSQDAKRYWKIIDTHHKKKQEKEEQEEEVKSKGKSKQKKEPAKQEQKKPKEKELFKCRFCDKELTSRSGIYRHEKTKHPAEFEKNK